MKSINENDPVISISHLSKFFGGRPIFNDLSFVVFKGDFLTLIGKSGTGKTTLLNIIGLLDKNYSGSVTFLKNNDIKAIKNMDALRKKEIGYLFQSFYLLDYLNVKENILLPFKYVEEKPDMNYFTSLCDELAISNILELNCNVLSGGEKQRVSLARALIKKPSILICDEPTGNLDRESRDIVLSLLMKINEKHGTTVIIVTHDDYIASKGNRRFILEKGTINEASH
ncbi:MAG: ABC transporter ATP-binding protein [Bacilli bacterium]|nr:ABC transporter ATP-binding protein [Bacilli bacterium]